MQLHWAISLDLQLLNELTRPPKCVAWHIGKVSAVGGELWNYLQGKLSVLLPACKKLVKTSFSGILDKVASEHW